MFDEAMSFTLTPRHSRSSSSSVDVNQWIDYLRLWKTRSSSFGTFVTESFLCKPFVAKFNPYRAGGPGRSWILIGGVSADVRILPL